MQDAFVSHDCELHSVKAATDNTIIESRQHTTSIRWSLWSSGWNLGCYGCQLVIKVHSISHIAVPSDKD